MNKTFKFLCLLLSIGLLFSIQNTQASKNSSLNTVNKARTVTIDKLPTTVEEFLAMRDKISTTPEGGATTMLVALMIYSKDAALGLPCLTIAIDKKWLTKGAGGYKGYIPSASYLGRIKDQLKRYPYVPFSYIEGSKVDNGYEMPSGKLTFTFTTNPYSGEESSGTIKLFIASSGADSARPITVHKNDQNIWKAHEWSSLIMGIRAPKVDDEDDL